MSSTAARTATTVLSSHKYKTRNNTPVSRGCFLPITRMVGVTKKTALPRGGVVLEKNVRDRGDAHA